MPYPYSSILPIWIHTCKQGVIGDSMQLESNPEDNFLLQINSGHCDATMKGETKALGARSLLFLGRNRTVTLTSPPEQECRYTLLGLHRVQSAPYLDLNRLCFSAPLVDSFFAQKGRFCVLEDRQFINMSLGEIRYEWENDLSERDAALRGTLENLFVRLARSFFSQHHVESSRYITQAKSNIHKYFQQPLTVESIAEGIGISRSYLEALFKRYMRGSFVDYVHAVRCDHAAKLLSTTGFPIIDIAMDSGFNNRQHFARVFKEIYGVTPSNYRKLNRGKP